MPKSTEERFWEKVNKTETCWLWTASLLRSGGYGQFSVQINGKNHMLRAHRVAWEWLVGPIPEDMILDHTCHVPACVNPEHLRVVTQKQNRENLEGAYVTSSSGVRGVSWSEERQKWVAQVQHYGHNYGVGRFDSLAEAEAAVVAKRLELFTHNDLDRAA